MKRFSEQFNKKANSLKLESGEKQALRERVFSYMEYHPLPNSVSSSVLAKNKTLATENYRVVKIPFLSFVKVGSALAVVVLVGVPVLAERAVPGDALYAIKVNLNEEVRSSLTLNPYNKVAWETERLNRRIAEAKLLASEGKLTEETEAAVASAVKEHAQAINQEIDEMRAVDADQATLATLELNTTLQVQAASLQGDETTGLSMVMSSEEAKTDTRFLVDALNESLANQSTVVAEIPAYEKIMARLEINTTRAYELLNSYQSGIDPEIQTDITRRLEDIGRGIVLVNESRSSDEALAQQELLDLLQRSKKLIVFITEISATDKTVLEKLVPKVLTPEEEQLQKVDWIAELDKNLAIMNQSKASTSAELTEKIDYTTSLVEENKAKAIATSDFKEIKPLLTESIQLTKDILLAIESEGISISVEIKEPVETDLPIETATTTEELATTTEELI